MAAASFVDLVAGIFTRKSAVETGPASAPAEQLVSTNANGYIDVTLAALDPATAAASTDVLSTVRQQYARSLLGF